MTEAAENVIEGCVPQGCKTYANAATNATSTQKAASGSISTVSAPRKSQQTQFGVILPVAIHAEALALARELGTVSNSQKMPQRNSMRMAQLGVGLDQGRVLSPKRTQTLPPPRQSLELVQHCSPGSWMSKAEARLCPGTAL